MRRLARVALFALATITPSLAQSDAAALAGDRRGCAEAARAAARRTVPAQQMAQGSCRADCRSRRGYCLSTCRDSQCRAICNDIYQSCVASCR